MVAPCVNKFQANSADARRHLRFLTPSVHAEFQVSAMTAARSTGPLTAVPRTSAATKYTARQETRPSDGPGSCVQKWTLNIAQFGRGLLSFVTRRGLAFKA